VALTEGKDVHTRFWLGDLRERGRLEDLGLGGRILKCIVQKWDEELWAGLIWLRIGKGFSCL